MDEAIERDWSRNISPTHLTANCGAVVFQERVDVPRGHHQHVTMTGRAIRGQTPMTLHGIRRASLGPDGRAAASAAAVAGVQDLPSAASLARLMGVGTVIL